MRKLTVLVSFLVFSGCTSCYTVQDTNKTPETREGMIEYVSARTVHVQIHRKLLTEDGKVYRKSHLYSYGSGTIFRYKNIRSYVLTAAHVVNIKKDAERVLYYDEKLGEYLVLRAKFFIAIERRNLKNEVIDKAVHGKIEAMDTTNDLAVVSVPYYFGVQNTRIAKESKLGEEIITMGYPSLDAIPGQHLSFSKGHIETFGLAGGIIRVSTNNYFGSSGGSVINSKGEITGVVCFMTGVRLGRSFIVRPGALYGPDASVIQMFLKKSKFL